jgi:adenosine deaminase
MAARRPALSDLHRHLDGSLRSSTLNELADAIGVEIPADLPFRAGMGLSQALQRFQVTLSVLGQPDAVRRVASEMCEDASADGVTTLEIRFAPQLHGHAGSSAVFVDAALDGISGRAGLILCGLYGEPPSVLDELVSIAAARQGVVGIDLAGGPAASHDFAMHHYCGAFERARELGLGRTVHAGEGRPAAEIRVAIEQLHAQRIGHGNSVLDDPAVADLVCERAITIEACPTSNVHTGIIGSVAEHPLPRWLERGIAVCINADNTLLSSVTASQEHDRARAIEGMSDALLEQAIACGHAAAFRRS